MSLYYKLNNVDSKIDEPYTEDSSLGGLSIARTLKRHCNIIAGLSAYLPLQSVQPSWPTSIYEKLNDSLRYLLFGVFFLLSLRYILSYLVAGREWMIIGGSFCVIIIFIFCWWNLFLCLFFFISFIPIISGFQNIGIMDGVPLFSFCFAAIYCAWFLKFFLYNKKKINVNNSIDIFIEALAGIIIVSLLMTLNQYPLEFVLYRIRFASVLRQVDPFWCLEASYLILQGLFLYRIISLEKSGKKWSKAFDNIIIFHTIVIMLFSFCQFFILTSKFNIQKVKIFWPFDDIHSYGSYVVFSFRLSFFKNHIL